MGFNSGFKGLKLYFLHTICYNSDMFRSILIIRKEILNIN